MSKAPSSPPVPEQIGPYRLEARLGKGGMGVVYRAFDERLRRRVAVKHVLAKEAEKANVRQRFRREARNVARLNHSAIVQIYDILETEDGEWIVMELVEGRTVRDLMDNGELTLETIYRLAREIAGGLAVAHDRGVVHRDLKVENVMVSEKGHAKILDFGLAKRLTPTDPSDTTLSGVGMVVGTFRAMSPEQILEEELDGRSDLFSFGVLLYEMCTGTSPFKANNVVTTMTRVCRIQQEPAIDVNKELPPELSRFIDCLLEKNPERRPQSAREVVTFFDELTGETTVLPPLEGLDLEPVKAVDDDALPFAPTEPMETAWLPAAAPRPVAPMPGSDSGIAIKTLVATEIVDRPRLGKEIGGHNLARVVERLSGIRGRLAAEHGGLELRRGGDVLLMFERPAAAVEFALAYRRQVAAVSQELEIPVPMRTGIHLGEVLLTTDRVEEVTRFTGTELSLVIATEEEATTQDTTAAEIERFTPLVTRSVMALGRPGQILFTHSVDELVKRGSVGHGFGEQEVTWQDHGLYRVPGVEEEIEIFEVGFVGDAPLMAPATPRGPAAPTAERRTTARTAGRSLRWGVLVVLSLLAGFLVFRGC